VICSIEVPVIRGGWLMQCIDSVLQQRSRNWLLSLLWDQGDELAARILARVEAAAHPRIRVHRAAERLGIARARQFLTERARGELVLPLDDDDVLLPDAVGRFLETAAERPWAGIIRARRVFIDDHGQPVLMKDWFEFAPRQYDRGATLDVTNHSQPYAIRRSRLLAVGGWTGFPDYEYLGEDCSSFMHVEEGSDIALLDEELYAYRLHGQRTSLRYDTTDADELWRRIADAATTRRHLLVQRVNDRPPFVYRASAWPAATVADIDFVIPFVENGEREIEYAAARPMPRTEIARLGPDTHFVQRFEPALRDFCRVELALTSSGPVAGVLEVALFTRYRSFSPARELRQRLDFSQGFEFDVVSLAAAEGANEDAAFERLEVSFTPGPLAGQGRLFLYVATGAGAPLAMLRLFRHEPGYARHCLDLCLASVRASGASDAAIHVIDKKQGSSANRNEAFRGTTRPWICFLDDDAELAAASTLQLMLDRMRKWEAHLCGPKLLTPSGRLYSGLPYMDPITQDARVAGMGDPDTGQHDVTTLAPWLPATVLLTHRSVMHATGGFDEDYLGSQHEDVDFALRARARGFSCLYAGEAAAIHRNSLRNGRFRRNMDYLKARWRDRPDLFTWRGRDA
jgi:GT2 family glycosyltransferase